MTADAAHSVCLALRMSADRKSLNIKEPSLKVQCVRFGRLSEFMLPKNRGQHLNGFLTNLRGLC